MRGLQKTVGIRNTNWHHDHEDRCFNVNLNVNPDNSKLNTCLTRI
ncbi:MAG: hypothetical protein NT120_04465 [Candidatus Aenigmarchaeota archaeon]|nr:hypothetical protein [Candidatus Aenigmarchaeota archaeon]